MPALYAYAGDFLEWPPARPFIGIVLDVHPRGMQNSITDGVVFPNELSGLLIHRDNSGSLGRRDIDMTWALDGNHLEVVSALLDKQSSSVNEVLMSGISDGKPELVKLALAKGGLNKETLTVALAIAGTDKDKAEMADLLKKAGAVPPPEIGAAVLQTYAGKYKAETPAMEVTIVFNDGFLSGAVVGQRPQRLMALDDTTFRPMFVDGVFVRFKVESGKVTGLTLTQGQNSTQLIRVAETK